SQLRANFRSRNEPFAVAIAPGLPNPPPGCSPFIIRPSSFIIQFSAPPLFVALKMPPFTTHTGLVACMDRANVDTDQIIPKQFLKRIERTGYGPFLFYDWRYLDDGKTPNPEFELNQPQAAGASILLARRNFGCGSSREHAVW